MLRRLKINQYRNVKPGTELTFSGGIHVLLGPNGGGKTTLLDLISMICSLDFSRIAGEDFSFEASFEFKRNVVEFELENTTAPFDPLNLIRAPSQSRARVRVEDRLGQLLKTLEATSASGTWVEHGQAPRPTIGLDLYDRDRAALVLTDSLNPHGKLDSDWDELVLGYCYRFDELLSYYDLLHGEESPLGAALQLTCAVSKSGEAVGIISPLLFPNTFADAFIRAFSNNPGSTELRVDHEKAKFLLDFITLAELSSASMTAQLEGYKSTERVWNYNQFRYYFKHHNGATTSSKVLSFGQKRLFAFLHYLNTVTDSPLPYPIVADELVDGMHHRWLESLLNTIRDSGRQAFLSSQNPLLFDFLYFYNAGEVADTFIICDIERSNDRDWLHWHKLNDDEAAQFYAGYETGIQHVSEILRDQGFW